MLDFTSFYPTLYIEKSRQNGKYLSMGRYRDAYCRKESKRYKFHYLNQQRRYDNKSQPNTQP
jgi:hypothetical protein